MENSVNDVNGIMHGVLKSHFREFDETLEHPLALNMILISKFSILVRLETLNKVGCMAQPECIRK